jgi:penicillin-binding protein 1A
VEQDMKAWCKKNGHNLYKDGLKIYTSLDTTMQQYAEEAVIKQM